tara:strand:- start:519 stop:650 length:132 start_codon:yes stop_codon:yes gene_type:complete
MATYTVMSDDDNLSQVLEELEGDFEFEEALEEITSEVGCFYIY